MAGLIVILGVTGAVWAALFAMRGSVLATCGLYLVAASMFGVQFLDLQVGSVSLSLDRLLLLLLIGMYALRVILDCHHPQPIALAELFGGLFLLTLVVNTFSHDWRYHGQGQVAILPHLIEGYLIPAVLYWIARNSVADRRSLDQLYAVLVLFAIYLALTAICEITQTWSLVFPRYIADPQVGIHFGRARGPFLQSVRLGVYLSLGLGITWLTLVWRGAWGRGGRVLGLAICLLLVVAIGLTYTRSVWLGVAVAGLIVGLLTFPRPARRTLVVMTLMATVAAFTAMGPALVSFKREYGSQETAESTRMRAVFAYVSWLMFQDKPLTGFGFGHYPHENRPYLNDRSTDLELQSIRGYVHHNTLLSILVELGLLGFVPFIAMLVMWSRCAWQLWRNAKTPAWMKGHAVLLLALLGTFITQMLFHDVTYSVVELGSLFLCAGIVSGLAAQCRLPAARPIEMRGWIEWVRRRAQAIPLRS